jgi:1-acyl-sn-glycerol-3-phosphate acyltransferase
MEEQSRVLRWLHRRSTNTWGTDPSAIDLPFVESTLERVGKWFGPGKYFRVTVDGWENLPPAPAFLVSNHSGGTSIPDAWGFAWAWYGRFGTGRILHPMAHEMVLSTRLTGPTFSKLGILRTSPDRAREVVEKWHRDVMVMPGGDRDTWRPWTQRYKVQFAGRTGYARLALQLGVPVVPIAHAGAHGTLLVLTDGAKFAKRIGLPRLARASVFPVHLSLPWGLAVGPMPHVPVPAHLRYRIGAPVPLPEGPVTDEAVRAYDAAVRAALQAELDVLSEGSKLKRLLRRRKKA